MRVRHVLLALAVVGLAACDTSHPPVVAPARDTSAPPAVTASAPVPRSPSARAGAGAGATTAPATRVCGATDLRASATNHESHRVPAPWAFDVLVSLTNRSSSACTLNGWAEFTMVGKAQLCDDNPFVASPCAPDLRARPEQQVSRVDLRPPQLYVVRPGEYVAFDVLWNHQIVAQAEDCPGPWFADPYEAEIRVPGDKAPIILRPVPLQPCQGKVGVTALGVTL